VDLDGLQIDGQRSKKHKEHSRDDTPALECGRPLSFVAGVTSVTGGRGFPVRNFVVCTLCSLLRAGVGNASGSPAGAISNLLFVGGMKGRVAREGEGITVPPPLSPPPPGLPTPPGSADPASPHFLAFVAVLCCAVVLMLYVMVFLRRCVSVCVLAYRRRRKGVVKAFTR